MNQIEVNNTRIKQDGPEIENLWVHYYENWIWRAVESLATAKDFDPSIRSIATRLNISTEKAVDAVEGLLKIGLLVRQKNTYAKPQRVTSINREILSAQSLLAGHAKMANQIITKLDVQSIFSTRFCLGSDELIRKHAIKIQDFFNSLDLDGEKLENPDVISIEISIANLTRKTTGGLQ